MMSMHMKMVGSWYLSECPSHFRTFATSDRGGVDSQPVPLEAIVCISRGNRRENGDDGASRGVERPVQGYRLLRR